MEYVTAKQISLIWGISERRIIKLCSENRINGAIKNGMMWEIPKDTKKPSDKRSSIYKYIDIEKKILIINCKKEIKPFLENKLLKHGYISEFKKSCDSKYQFERYYEGLIIFSEGNNKSNEESFINFFSNRLNFESSVVIVSYNNKRDVKMAEELKRKVGLRINGLILDICKDDVDIDFEEISENIINLLENFKNTTGAIIATDGGKIQLDKNKRTKALSDGEFYSAISKYFKKLNSDSYLWCASTMLEDEWTEEPQEMKFRVINLEAANRGVKIDRIFIFKKSRIKEFKNNKTLKIYMQSNINTLFVDYDEILEKKPDLLKKVGAGWDGIDKSTLIADIDDQSKGRGYISKNTKDVMNAYNCFQELKQYSKKLKEVLK